MLGASPLSMRGFLLVPFSDLRLGVEQNLLAPSVYLCAAQWANGRSAFPAAWLSADDYKVTLPTPTHRDRAHLNARPTPHPQWE